MCLKAGMGNSMVAVIGNGCLASPYSTYVIRYVLLNLKLHWPKVSLFFLFSAILESSLLCFY